MSLKIELVIPGQTTPKERPRTTTVIESDAAGEVTGKKTWGYTPPRSRHYAKLAGILAQNYFNKNKLYPIPYPNPVKLTIEFILNRKATAVPDIGNLANQIMDVLQGIAYENDSQVTKLYTTKVKGKYPMTKIIIEDI